MGSGRILQAAAGHRELLPRTGQARMQRTVPEISKFYGIRIEMFFNDHNPPHFHVKYGEYKAEIDIRTLGILTGWLPPKAQSLVIEWALAHREELLTDWQLAREHKTLNSIEPLE